MVYCCSDEIQIIQLGYIIWLFEVVAEQNPIQLNEWMNELFKLFLLIISNLMFFILLWE